MIVDAQPGEVRRVAALLGEAFAPTPQSRWIAPDDTDRTHLLATLFAPLIRHAVTYGTVGVILDHRQRMCAAAVWLPSDVPGLAELPEWGRRTERWAKFLSALDAHHPTVPHQHLVLMGVDPSRQGLGIGTRLLEHYHRDLHRPAYLEAETPRLVALYRRYDYQPGQAFTMPSDLPMWPMWRPARRADPG